MLQHRGLLPLAVALLTGCSKPAKDREVSCESAADRLVELSDDEAKQGGLPLWTPEKKAKKKARFVQDCHDQQMKPDQLACVLAATNLPDAQRCLPRKQSQ